MLTVTVSGRVRRRVRATLPEVVDELCVDCPDLLRFRLLGGDAQQLVQQDSADHLGFDQGGRLAGGLHDVRHLPYAVVAAQGAPEELAGVLVEDDARPRPGCPQPTSRLDLGWPQAL